MLQHVWERMAPSLEMNSLAQVIYKRGFAFTYRNFKNVELLRLLIIYSTPHQMDEMLQGTGR